MINQTSIRVDAIFGLNGKSQRQTTTRHQTSFGTGVFRSGLAQRVDYQQNPPQVALISYKHTLPMASLKTNPCSKWRPAGHYRLHFLLQQSVNMQMFDIWFEAFAYRPCLPVVPTLFLPLP